ncbi:MAG: TlyA family RNA methyltransferase [Elusimicrobiales bacterium]|nr:TlyA family RNA methyltransferase [Elusimicrobiales bacterium]
MKKRLDIKCVEVGLFESREKARRAIMAGEVLVNGIVVDDASFNVCDSDIIEIKKNSNSYVSRAGSKLEAALDHFKIYLTDKICLDVGVATGGFSDCMLQKGAKKVYGIDVGKGQVHEKILRNPKFVFIPHTNARFLKKELFKESIDFFAIDVSFISVKLILKPVLDVLNNKGSGVVLVKPQFELSKQDLKKGIVRNDVLRKKALDDILNFMSYLNEIRVVGFIDSPVKGVSGNTEFLVYIEKIIGI